MTIPRITLNSGRQTIPVLGLSTGSFPPVGSEAVKLAVLQAIELGVRHFDTGTLYGTELPVGEAVAEALSLGLIKSRDELFITSKIWINDAHCELVLSALRKTLENLKLDHLDLYLIHWPVSLKPGPFEWPIRKEGLLPMDFKSVWAAMEDCQRLGLTRSIGVANFSCKKLGDILATAKIPPAICQVEMNPMWQQKKLINFCEANGILVAAYYPVGFPPAVLASNKVMECEVLKEIEKAKGKTLAQVCLRWAYEQGAVVVMKGFDKERMKQNLEIFDWELSAEESKKISEIPQNRGNPGVGFVSEKGPFKSVEELWDEEL